MCSKCIFVTSLLQNSTQQKQFSFYSLFSFLSIPSSQRMKKKIFEQSSEE
jgi:hypothetical protein